VVSKDSKTMTVTVDEINANGAKIHDGAVYERQ
jgi:hypothetical protein